MTAIDIESLVEPPASKPLQPIPTPPSQVAQFPRTEETPEGCIVIDDLDTDDFLYSTYITHETYVTRALADGTELPLGVDIYTPFRDDGNMPNGKPEAGWPVIVYMRGAAFHKPNPSTFNSLYIRLAEKGYVVVVPEYRPSDIAPFPAQMQDCKTAVRYVRANAERLGVDSERIGLFGDSSGGHTVLMAGFTGDTAPDTPDYQPVSAEVKCIVDWYGPTDFAMMNYYPSSQNHAPAECPEGMEIGGVNVLEHPELSRKASPMTYLSTDRVTPPTLIMHGGRDLLVPFNQSCRLYATMKALGKDVAFYKLSNASHAAYGFRSDRAVGLVLDWLAERL
ncbi:alpha/beta hydrolase [Bifidobacterium reuteri]|uniref:Alpha/beta hydrolase n=1 Tax=Bifidobacterium reuteri TaxID=983706 RepID=A0A5J5EC22_9BIFI|nr:alpha/beta hydrolase [Bifidobacterium reuteri]KAA8826790.1 alpha/beta hydrolase [Bifidobacterium reuteri]